MACVDERISDLYLLAALHELGLLKARRDRGADTKDWALYLSLRAPDHVSHSEGFPRWGSAQKMIDTVTLLMAKTGLRCITRITSGELECPQ